MPNNRNKNRNRNKNKQRIKQQQQQQQQQEKEEKQKQTKTENTTAPTTNSQESPPPNDASQHNTINEVRQLNASVVDLEHNNVAKIDAIAAAASAAIIDKVPDINTNVSTATTNDTVSNEPSVCANTSKSEINYAVNADADARANNNMGNEKSKFTENNKEEKSSQIESTVVTSPKSPLVGKVIVHRIICEDTTNKADQSNPVINLLTISNENELTTRKEQHTTATSEACKVNKLYAERAEETKQDQNEEELQQQNVNRIIKEDTTRSENKYEADQFKAFIHEILSTPEQELTTAHSQPLPPPAKVIIHKISGETNEATEADATEALKVEDQQTAPKVIVHQVAVQEKEQPQALENEPGQQEPSAKVIVNKVTLVSDNDADDSSSQSDGAETATEHQVKVIVHHIHVEGRDKSQDEDLPIITSPVLREPMRQNSKPSTSDVHIVEISDESLSDLEELRSPVVSEAESSVEYCDEIQQISECITEISSTTSSSSSTTANQKQSRKQKRKALEHHFLPQMLNPRFLDSISEENSELSDNSDNPLSRSASTDSATNCPTEAKVQKLNAKFPKSSLDFTKPHKHHHNTHRKSKVIREEPIAMAVSARLQDAPDTEADESCTTLRTCMSPEAEAAEVVIINSASSSISDLHDMELYDNVPLLNVNTSLTEYDSDKVFNELINKSMIDNICASTLTSSSSSPPPASRTAPTALANVRSSAPSRTENIPEFSKNETINNNRQVNNCSPLNRNETKTNTTTLTTDSRSSIPSSSTLPLATTTPTPANEHLAFAQIEEQISSVLSSINEVAEQNKEIAKTATTTTTTITSTTSCMKNHANLSNTQKLPVTTQSITTTTTAPIAAATASAPELATRMLETSCESFNTASSSCAGNNAKTTRLLSYNGSNNNMNTVRDLLNNNCNNNDNNCSDESDTVKLTLNDLKPNSTITTTQVQCSQNGNSDISSTGDPKKLRLLCAETVASLPYGDEVLEELASVAQTIGEARAVKAIQSQDNNMPYPLPQLPHINDLQLSLNVGKINTQLQQQQQQQKSDLSWLGVPTATDPKLLVCLSPSQRSYIQQKPEQKPDDLLDAHQKFVERRGYHEYTKEQLEILEREKLAEQQLLQTAAIMKKLRKSITPPPQIPPPPVPLKSSETATKAQNLSKRTLSHTQNGDDDANYNRDGEQTKASANGESNGEEKNKHRLLSIINDANESSANKQKHSPTTPSSYENNSRQTANGHSVSNVQQVVTSTSELDKNTSKNTYQFPQLSEQQVSGKMQGVETALGQMFPTMGNSNIFDQQHKRFSNIDSSSKEPFCSQLVNTQPKRYSSVETHYFESQKRCENGQVVQDFTTSKHESKTTGDKSDTNFPLETSLSPESNSFFRSGIEPELQDKTKTAQNSQDDDVIMSALKLNKQSSATEKAETKTAKTLGSKTTIETMKTIEDNFQNKNANDERKRREILQQYEEEKATTAHKNIHDSYEEFRQRAKAAADAASTLPKLKIKVAAPLTEKVTSKGDNGDVISSAVSSETTTSTTEQKKLTTISRDHEKLFKEFDDLSKQLHKELETSNVEREQREKSASMFDLHQVHMRHKQQIEEYNKGRHEHLKELEQQIERSMRSRSLLFNKTPEPTANSFDMVDHQIGRTYEIPIRMENGYTAMTASANKEAPPVPEAPKTYNIPIQMETSNNGAYVDDSRFRRAESMFNLSDDMHHSQGMYSNQSHFLRAEDDWSKYASDLGSSENIVRPFAKEVEICYQRRPAGIRAPRLTASTNDLSFNQQHSYDQYNAYNVRRHHAPMLSRAPEMTRPKFGSCYSMIERDPNPKYISTTTRRGVSPAPQPSGFFALEGCHVREEEMRQRRASLPKEIHEQQLKYIASKEEELRTEFERLQAERKRLMEEAQKAQSMQTPQTPTSPATPTRLYRDGYRSTQKLPTLTEDEVFRQQMAEEWLNKVAEREKRRLQNIIKISKIDEDEATAKHKADMEQEFLSRVKERRHKLAMPADSDWESGAESQPTAQAQHSETEDVPPVKIIEGEKEANLRRLPRHLREFAKFSNHQNENIEGGHREEHQEEERSAETTDNSVSRAVKKSSMVKTVKTLRAPMLPAAKIGHGHDDNQHLTNHKPRVNHHQLPVRPRDPHLTDRGQRKNTKHTRFAVNSNRRSWSESDLLQEIEKDLKLAKGFLFQDVYNVKYEYMSEPETENEHPKKMAQLGRRQYDGIGPMTNDGMPIILRSEVKEPHQHEWYKRLYQTIHKQKHGGRNLYNKPNGYQSEPEPNYDSDYSTIKYRTVNPNRLQSVSSAVNVRKSNDTLYGTLPNPVKSGQSSYRNQPGRIEDYITGHSSVSEKEKKEWWDEIMDIFNVEFDQAKLSSNYTEGNLSRALAKESGYTSDSNLVFRRKEISQSSPFSPIEQKQAYKSVQAGGEPPLFGFRKPAPEKSKVSPNRYYESDVNIHFKAPVRQEFKYPLSEEELAIRQAEQMQKLYQEERRRKYLQELQDMNSRRHTDNFTPSQKSPIPLNRYDDFPADLAPKTGLNHVKSVARALYNFQAQNSKELSFKKGDIIYIRRAIDKNWYEGEHNAMIGIFPANYVEIINKESLYPVQPQANAYRKPSEGQARAKYNFQAQSAVELSLNKGELVALTRRVDDNWFEGRIANRKGIFPVSYVEVLTDIGAEDIAARTTTIQQSRPTLDALRTNINNEFNTLTRNGNQPPNAILRETRNHKTDILHVDTSSEPLVYRALYKYRPQNSDELELQEGDIVHVLEKCDDGWYVGTSQRTGCFGTFPGNYVERV